MKLHGLLPLIWETQDYRLLREKVFEPGSEGRAIVLEAAKPALVAALYEQCQVPVLVITAHPENVRRIQEQLSSWLTSPEWVWLFPESDAMTYEDGSCQSAASRERLQVLAALAFSEKEAPLVVTSVAAFAAETISLNDFHAMAHVLQRNLEVDLPRLIARWQPMGYEMVNVVEVPGTMARRGGIVDIFSPGSSFPFRIELLGKRIESIRFFDPETQRSLESIATAIVTPAREIILPERGNLLSYMREDALVVVDCPGEVEAVVGKLHARDEIAREEMKETGEVLSLPPSPYFAWEELRAEIGNRKRLLLEPWEGATGEDVQKLPFALSRSYGGKISLFIEEVKRRIERKQRIVVVSNQASRLSELLREQDMYLVPENEIVDLPPPGSISLLRGSLAEGWEIKSLLTVITDAELFGPAKHRPRKTERKMTGHLVYGRLAPGDYVVHVDHGIGKFRGLTIMSVEGIEQEYLVLEYAAGDRIYVPADQVGRVTAYLGNNEKLPSLNRLGTHEWERTKQRIKHSVASIARELLSFHAAREATPGFAFSQDTLWQQEMEDSFPYVETPDQREAIAAVKQDMEKPRPMDRLICGDVGYGKTEVALRAAFKAVMDSKQVVLLCPTTILAQQHFATFRERLQPFPVKVGILSRFCSCEEEEEVTAGLSSGVVDICIGTHRLLQKDVLFSDLGLVIIDEEQHFGVVQKEGLKRLKENVDVLALSATPIPRTLHMSLVGIRDISIIETPPEERLAVKTQVSFFDEGLIKRAVLRELERNGQVFFVHNRIRSIFSIAARLQELLPDVRMAVSHGRMPEQELEKVMQAFLSGKLDVLVTTTIIQMGLDMPRVNTLIVDQADKLGLTQLYQLRGRVGRGADDAHAYFLVDKGKQLTPQAYKRLRTIFEADELGAGLGIAMKDMEIRGTGNLLGTEQSGHIVAVGFELYTRLLAEAVEELRSGREECLEEKTIAGKAGRFASVVLPVSAYIPEGYVTDLDVRLLLYRRLTEIRTVEEIEDIGREMEDRFGQVPAPVQNLLYVVRIRILSTLGGVMAIFTSGRHVVVKTDSSMLMDRVKKVADSQYRGFVKVGSAQIRLDTVQLGDRWQNALEEILQNMA